jgi:hypothetical protein
MWDFLVFVYYYWWFVLPKVELVNERTTLKKKFILYSRFIATNLFNKIAVKYDHFYNAMQFLYLYKIYVK